jgi:hypothetical protein
MSACISLQKDRKCRYNVTLRRVRELFLRWKINNYYQLFSVCVCVCARAGVFTYMCVCVFVGAGRVGVCMCIYTHAHLQIYIILIAFPKQQ